MHFSDKEEIDGFDSLDADVSINTTLGDPPPVNYYGGGSIYPTYVNQPETVRIVEETVTETFDDDGKLIERIKKIVTRYEKQPQYQIWNQSPNTQILNCTT